MIGVNRKLQVRDGVGPVISPATPNRVRTSRWHFVAVAALFVPLSVVLVQCGKAPSAGMLAANTQSASGDTFEDRFPAPQFRGSLPDREGKFRAAAGPAAARRIAAAATESARAELAGPGGVDCADSDAAAPERARGTDHAGQHEILGLPLFRQQSALRGAIPQHHQGRAKRPSQLFGGRVYWQDETYNDSRVLVHVPEGSTSASPA